MNEKELIVTCDPRGNRLTDRITLNGVLSSERLTPKMARRALRIAQGHDRSGEVWDKDFNLGYRVYARSARKVCGDAEAIHNRLVEQEREEVADDVAMFLEAAESWPK